MTYGKPELNQIIQAFTDFTGLEPTPEVSQRRYASLLHNKLTKKNIKTMDLVHYALSIQTDRYAPKIASPKDLYYKANDVIAYHKRQQTMEGGAVSL